MGQRDKRSLFSQLIRIMVHVIKWLSQPHKRSKSWSNSIYQGRRQIKALQNDNPKFTKNYIRQGWETSFQKAKRKAEKEMDKKSDIESLTEKQIFEDKYKPNSDDD